MINFIEYEISKSDLSKIITSALKGVRIDDKRSGGEYHKALSQAWVKHFAENLKSYYYKKGIRLESFFNQRVISKTTKIPSVKEFLFDITVAPINEIKQTSQPFIANPIWQIESEFRQLLYDMILDFQKLMSGNAPFKMMIGPLNSRNNSKRYRALAAELAPHVSGKLYFLFISHPSQWEKGKELRWVLFKWYRRKWGKVFAEEKWTIK